MLIDWFHVISIFSCCCRKLCKMPGNTLKLSGKVREFYFAQPVGTLSEWLDSYRDSIATDSCLSQY